MDVTQGRCTMNEMETKGLVLCTGFEIVSDAEGEGGMDGSGAEV